jgi:hypothetical protein
MSAYVDSTEGKGEWADILMRRFANSVAEQIAKTPALREAVAAHLASTVDNDP